MIYTSSLFKIDDFTNAKTVSIEDLNDREVIVLDMDTPSKGRARRWRCHARPLPDIKKFVYQAVIGKKCRLILKSKYLLNHKRDREELSLYVKMVISSFTLGRFFSYTLEELFDHIYWTKDYVPGIETVQPPSIRSDDDERAYLSAYSNNITATPIPLTSVTIKDGLNYETK